MWTALLLLSLATGPEVPASSDAKLVKMYVRNGVAELGLDARTPEGREKIARLERAVRDDLHDRAIVAAEARRRNLPVAARIDERRRVWITRMGGEAGYRAYLAEHQLTEADLERLIEMEIAGELLRDALARDVRVSDAEVTAFYERERSNPALEALFMAPETVTASHILVEARPGIHRDMDARRARAEQIHREVIAGGDFAALARKHSDDMGTREGGGALGAFPRETHATAFDQAAFALTPGETSAVIQTEYGFHIIRVTAKSPRRLRALDELHPAIRARLTALKTAEHLRAWLERKRAATSNSATSNSQVPNSQVPKFQMPNAQLFGGGRL